jgi:inorganic pyrophosphatase
MQASWCIGRTIVTRIDRPMGSRHPVHGFIYPVNYGHVPGTRGPDGEELDCYVLGLFEPATEFAGQCIAVIQRLDDDDDKLILAPEGVQYSDEQIRALTEFQERFFRSRILRDKAEPVNPWDAIFRQKGHVFPNPHEDMPEIARGLKARAARAILDLGCGSGRHVLFFAQHGFSVWGVDQSAAGIALTEQRLRQEGLSATLREHDITEPLPFEDAFFDAVISTQVIHHATLATIRAIIQEIERVLRTRGLIFVTVPSLRNQATRFEQIEPNTFIPLDGAEKGLPHHYFTPEKLREVFGNFDVLDLHLDAVSHYCLTAVKKS